MSDTLGDWQIRFPNWTGEAGKFEDHYELLFGLTYDLRDQNPERVALGPSSPRTCAICESTSPVATFRKDSHLIPAALGNRTFFSNEECDACNDTYGRRDDNELAKMLYGQRVLLCGGRLWRGCGCPMAPSPPCYPLNP